MPTVPPPGYRVDTAGNLIPDHPYATHWPDHMGPGPVYPYQPDPCIPATVSWPPPGGAKPREPLLDDLWRAGWPFPRPQPTERPEALRPEDV